MVSLLPDQQESIEKTWAAMKRRVKYVLMQGATGSGKSYIATAIIKRALNKDRTVWFIVPRRELIRQMAETFQDFGIEHGYIAAGYEFNPYSRAHICSLGTLQGRLDKLKAPALAFIDETHYGSEGLDTVIKWLKAAGTWIIGLSATPWKMSGQGLGCWYEEMINGPSVRWLIDNKRLSEYRAFAPSHLDLSGIKITAGDYAKGQLAEKMEQDRVLIGNAVNHYKKNAADKLGITFCTSIKHSQLMAQSYRDSGVQAMHIDGKTPDDERAKIARAFAKREIMQLCNAALLTFGYDLSSASGIKGVCIQSMSDCDPTLSLAKQSQKWGRNLRYDGTVHTFFDHGNNIDVHGLPCDDRDWSLEDREKKQGCGERVLPIRQCSKCFFCHKPLPTCPNCGEIYPIQSREIESIEGELSEIDIAKQKKKERMQVGMAKTKADLWAIAKERNYAPGWVYHQAKLKNIQG